MLMAIFAFPSFSSDRPQRLQPTISPAPTIISIVPSQAEQGSQVILQGSGFSDSASVFMGDVEIPTNIDDGKQAEFTVPSQLKPGLYTLYLKRSDGVKSRPYSFTVQPIRPVLIEISPDHILACAQSEEREVVAYGQNFNDKSLLFFDGAGIRSQLISSEAISFRVPQVAGGLHSIMVKNSQENSSLPLALTIETKPEIDRITIGDDHVSYYELIIDGKNFQQISSVYVDGQRVGGRGGQEISEREQLVYVDCTRLIYQRHPYSKESKEFHIQVVNKGGEERQMVSLNAP